ncbi:ferrous iron transport protein B [Anaerocolumna xylanovorans]|uniref:Ferrous iron transport protein B n=1 Tax=Anaerocolumna xylanovorans DSM 12503 TaxID=1121345 RepID=A0A1M7Y0G2_9FIRM|nr:ferrous iron transport protein B [Anaerocolumna xylanovorans]SHO44829.1 ferrous iron transport protein B [Anaerocolumna xylanovorans DSM 12503]
MITFALVGNQNCGKTTLFNQLTGSNQHVGNFPGVTVERKEGIVRKQKDVTVVDLPGIYSLSPYTKEEIVTRDFIAKGHPNGIINIVDATNIERNLYLSLQLIQFGIPMVIALNMMDEIEANGGVIQIKELQERLGVPVVFISAVKNIGVEKLIKTAVDTATKNRIPKKQDFYSGLCAGALTDITNLLMKSAGKHHIPAVFAATKLLENDSKIEEDLQLSEAEEKTIERRIRKMENELLTDRKAAVADMRYRFIDDLCAKTVIKPKESKQHLRSIRVDNVLANRYFAIPIFLGIMFVIFWLTFGVIGSFLSDLLGNAIQAFSDYMRNVLIGAGASSVMVSLVSDGVLAGVGSVLSFVPTIVVLFLFLALLEDSGYMARVAFIMDKLLRKIGLSGRSFVPMIIGFGCSVPAVMATRTLPSERDRKMTIFFIPFMSCSAKLPIYGMFTMAFFPRYRAVVMISLYIFGMVMGIISTLFLKKYVYKGEPDRFVMELPNYRLPGTKSVLLLLWDKTKDFLTRAFTVIFLATIVIWFLQKFNWQLKPVEDSSASILAGIGHVIAPVFTPLGFDDWRVSTALITGFIAKEAVVSTFGVLTGAGSAKLPLALGQIMTPMAAYSFLIFTLIYSPCVAAISVVKRELNTRTALSVAAYQTIVAWGCAMVVYQVGRLLF